MDEALAKSMEQRKLELEWQKAQLDAEVRRAELEEKRAAREGEQRLKERELGNVMGRGIRFTAAQATVTAAVLTLAGGMVGGLIQASTTRDTEAAKNKALVEIEQVRAKASIDLEKQKQDSSEKLARQNFEIGLILKAIAAPTQDERVRSLQFFVKAGFIVDDKGKIAAMAPEAIPFLPPPKPATDPSGLPAPLVDILRKYEGANVDWDAVRALVPRVTALAKVPLNDNQLAALVSFSYNIGLQALTVSTLIREINAGNTDRIADEFKRWARTGNTVLPGLVQRRQEEATLFLRPPADDGSAMITPANPTDK